MLRSYERGILTSASIVANGEDFADAARALREASDLDAGVHLTFVGERPLSPAAEVPTLLGKDGALLPDHRSFLRRYYAGAISLEEFELEARRQIARARDAGITVRHLNSHQHLHALPPLFDVVIHLAEEHGVPYVRLPQDAYPRPRRFGRWLAVRALAHLAGTDRKRPRGSGVRVNDRTIGVMEAGRLTAPLLLALLDHVEGVTELVSHPGEGDAEIAARYGWRYGWDAEREALCDPRVRERIAELGITLARVRDLPT